MLLCTVSDIRQIMYSIRNKALGIDSPPSHRNRTCHFRKIVNIDGSLSPALRLCDSFWKRQVHHDHTSLGFTADWLACSFKYIYHHKPFPYNWYCSLSFQLSSSIVGSFRIRAGSGVAFSTIVYLWKTVEKYRRRAAEQLWQDVTQDLCGFRGRKVNHRVSLSTNGAVLF